MNTLTLPAATDIHVHLRDPGQTYKEDIASGTRAARRGGVAAVACMPNTRPVIDNADLVETLYTRVAREAVVDVHIIAAVTVGQRGLALTDFEALKRAGAVALSDDGVPVRDDALMAQALLAAQRVGLPLIDHCEPETENIERDIALVRQTKAPIHIAHVSRAASLALIRAAKAEGLPITCETCPHYFFFTDERHRELGGNAQMNPPLASQADVQAVIEALRDGTIDCITTDHAPHHRVEKARPLPPNGILGLETLWPATLTALYFTGLLPLDTIVDKLCHAPRRILKLPPQTHTIDIDLDAERVYQVHPDSRCVNTPFAGVALRGHIIKE